MVLTPSRVDISNFINNFLIKAIQEHELLTFFVFNNEMRKNICA